MPASTKDSAIKPSHHSKLMSRNPINFRCTVILEATKCRKKDDRDTFIADFHVVS